ncbi:MAG: T9SS type A sorting domain-containing protein [candidate division Zixibacteria bacterium]|nr:T9SS type A sorting domain-containing protein [candidate division Zixibacteria bacterium]
MFKFLLRLTAVIVLSALFTAPAWADWYPSDGHKMHWPQFPDSTSYGWDVNATFPVVLADDWECSESGWIKDIHFWGSWRYDDVGFVDSFLISFHYNDPGPPSKPVNPPIAQFIITDYIERPVQPFEMEGWYDPSTGDFGVQDHWQYFQYNIFLDDDLWFWQDEGQIYWVNISAFVRDTQTKWGWKSTADNFMDDACWAFEPDYDWHEMYEPPNFYESLDLSFVVNGDTPDDTCMYCTTYTTTPIVPNVNGTIIWSTTVTNCGTATINVFGEIYPTLGDCASGTRLDYNLRKNMVNGLIAGASFTGYYWYIPGTVTGFTTVALETGVGTAYENYYDYCCFDFFFAYVWGRPGGQATFGPGEWGEFTDAVIPNATSLGQNYPNPFNATTTIPFDVVESGNVSLRVYNLAGQLVETLLDGEIEAGQHTVIWDASTYASGVYFYKLQTAKHITTKKMHLMK